MTGGSPTQDPLGYPGDVPAGPFVLDHGSVRAVAPGEPGPGRHAVVAAGSNAAPARLVEKLGPDAVVPVLVEEVAGIDVRCSAHVTRYGSVPATCWPSAGTAVVVPVTYLDDEQLDALDATEPNYDRIRLPSGHHAYVSRRGWYRLADGEPALPPLRGRATGRHGRVLGQAEVLADVLAVVRQSRPDDDLPDVRALLAALRDPDADLTPAEATALLAAAGRASSRGAPGAA